jgi:nitrite reductase (NO-forming)
MRLSRRSMLVAAIVLAVALAGVGGFFALYDSTSSTRVAGGGTKVIAVALVDAPVGFDVTPDVVTVDPGTRLVLEVVNKAGEVHDLAVRNGPHTRMLNPGQSQRLDLGLVTSRLAAWCTIPGHKTAGMALDLRVAGTAAAPTPAGLVHPRGAAGFHGEPTTPNERQAS